ncbi:hypothetical protein PAUR_a0229 [Pseudoalteromonas aurantia 208]|uniref:Orphan protein n=1 Tax=Pseudoalteromonas aurantia 208 TaxID=1314867 RepID=A0ABR9E7H9_9GAMM|nr:hypothetical protein [Pseudoalteromonas aurantia 208]
MLNYIGVFLLTQSYVKQAVFSHVIYYVLFSLNLKHIQVFM